MTLNTLTQEENELRALSMRMARIWAQRRSGVDAWDLVQSCWCVIPDVIKSFDRRKSSLKHWGRIHFAKILHGELRKLAPVVLGEARALRVAKLGKYEQEYRDVLLAIRRSPMSQTETLLEKAEHARVRLEKARCDALSVKGYRAKGADGEELELEEWLGFPEEPLSWEVERQHKRFLKSLAATAERNRKILCGFAKGLGSRANGQAVNLTHTRVNEILRSEYSRMRKELEGHVDLEMVEAMVSGAAFASTRAH